MKRQELQHNHAWSLLSMSLSALLSSLDSASLKLTSQSDLVCILTGVFSVDSAPNSIGDMQLLYTEPSAVASGDAQELSLATPTNEPATDQITGHPQLSPPPNTLTTGEQRDPQGQHHHPYDQGWQAAAAEQVFLYLQVQLRSVKMLICLSSGHSDRSRVNSEALAKNLLPLLIGDNALLVLKLGLGLVLGR